MEVLVNDEIEWIEDGETHSGIVKYVDRLPKGLLNLIVEENGDRRFLSVGHDRNKRVTLVEPPPEPSLEERLNDLFKRSGIYSEEPIEPPKAFIQENYKPFKEPKKITVVTPHETTEVEINWQPKSEAVAYLELYTLILYGIENGYLSKKATSVAGMLKNLYNGLYAKPPVPEQPKPAPEPEEVKQTEIVEMPDETKVRSKSRTTFKSVLNKLRAGKSQEDAWGTYVKNLGKEFDTEFEIVANQKKDLLMCTIKSDTLVLKNRFKAETERVKEHFRVDITYADSGVQKAVTLTDGIGGDYPNLNFTAEHVKYAVDNS
jgi:hypothetical protein